MAPIDFLVIPLVLLTGHFIISRVVRKHGLHADRSLLTRLFYYHLAFSLLYAGYVTIFGGDSPGYWRFPRFYRTSVLDLLVPGTPFVHLLTYPFAQIIEMSFWAGTCLFSLFGFGGVVCIYLTMRRLLTVNPVLYGYKLFPIVLFLPNMHFWSGGVGKDSVIFFALCLFIFSLTNLKGNIFSLAISLILAFYIRPHIAMVMVVSTGMALLFASRGISTALRVLFLCVSIVVFIVISPTVFKFIGVEQESIESYEDISNIRSQNLSRARVGSRIEVTNMPVPLRMFTFFFRPLFIDGTTALGLVVSFENLFYLLLTLSVLKWRVIRTLPDIPLALKAGFVMALATSFFMSGSLSNLGIVIRQKNMVMFMVVLISMYFLSQLQTRGIARGKRAGRTTRYSPVPQISK